jgi:hypothetical protein
VFLGDGPVAVPGISDLGFVFIALSILEHQFTTMPD